MWDKMESHKEIITQLRNSLLQDKVSHAYLFIGPRSDAKLQIARVFAASLLCDSEPKPCGTCRPCKMLGVKAHPDLIELEPVKGSLKLEQVRELLFNSHLSPVVGRRKVYLLHDVETLTLEAANSLLKQLEEPAGRTVFLLLANSEDVLSTIVSRCQVLRFGFTGDEATDSDHNAAELARQWMFMTPLERLKNMSQLERERSDMLVFADTLLWLFRDAYLYKLNASELLVDRGELPRRLSEGFTVQEIRRGWQFLLSTMRLLASNVNKRALADYLLWGLFNEVN